MSAKECRLEDSLELNFIVALLPTS